MALPASHGEYSFIVDSFYVEVNGNRHRRAAVSELKAHFAAKGAAEDRPGHWYAAQLKHYGLPASTNKGTSKMRLFEAVQKGSLEVPVNLKKIESGLKKAWAKSEREAKKVTAATQSELEPKKGTKRKNGEASHVSIGNGVKVNISISVDEAKKPSAKKQKVALSTTPTKPRATKPTASKSASAQSTVKNSPARASGSKAAIRKPTAAKATASTKRPAEEPKLTNASRPKQTARRGGSFRAPSTRPAVQSPQEWESPYLASDEPPPPYSEIPDHQPSDHSYEDLDNDTPRLGLLNGRYHIDCMEDSLDHDYESGLILTLDRTSLWGRFELGPWYGILHFQRRPYRASPEHELGFTWRGQEEGNVDEFISDSGFIRFLGDGFIQGTLLGPETIDFQGRRADGQSTRSEISPDAMRRDWDDLGHQL